MRMLQSFGPLCFRILMVSGLCMVVSLSVPLTTGAADADKPSEGISAEQTPEEAAGGRLNMLRIKKACEEDFKKLCPDVRPGGGRILKCLNGQTDKLTPACREVLERRSANR